MPAASVNEPNSAVSSLRGRPRFACPFGLWLAPSRHLPTIVPSLSRRKTCPLLGPHPYPSLPARASSSPPPSTGAGDAERAPARARAGPTARRRTCVSMHVLPQVHRRKASMTTRRVPRSLVPRAPIGDSST